MSSSFSIIRLSTSVELASLFERPSVGSILFRLTSLTVSLTVVIVLARVVTARVNKSVRHLCFQDPRSVMIIFEFAFESTTFCGAF